MRQVVFNDVNTGLVDVHLNAGRPVGGLETQQDLDRVNRAAAGLPPLDAATEYCIEAYRRSARGDGRMLTLAGATYGAQLVADMCNTAGLEFNERDTQHLAALVARAQR